MFPMLGMCQLKGTQMPFLIHFTSWSHIVIGSLLTAEPTIKDSENAVIHILQLGKQFKHSSFKTLKDTLGVFCVPQRTSLRLLRRNPASSFPCIDFNDLFLPLMRMVPGAL